MNVTIVKARCLRSGQCTYLHPKVFREGEDGYPELVLDPVPEELRAEADDAAEVCPASAIEVDA
jgi:ferredoxin